MSAFHADDWGSHGSIPGELPACAGDFSPVGFTNLYEENRQKAPYFSGGMNAVHRKHLLCVATYNTVMRKTYRYRLYPSKSQVTLLEQTLEICRWVYNDTLALRKNAWEQEQHSISLYETNKILTQWKKERPELNRVILRFSRTFKCA